jgi:hypothetical protein
MSERQTATEGDRSELRLELELERGRGDQGGSAAPPHPTDDMTICPCCGRDFVYPVDWAPAGKHRWSVALRCPECEWVGGGVYDQQLVDRFDDALDTSMQSILHDLEVLTRANMQERIEVFVEALQADLILPEDF